MGTDGIKYPLDLIDENIVVSIYHAIVLEYVAIKDWTQALHYEQLAYDGLVKTNRNRNIRHTLDLMKQTFKPVSASHV